MLNIYVHGIFTTFLFVKAYLSKFKGNDRSVSIIRPGDYNWGPQHPYFDITGRKPEINDCVYQQRYNVR